MRFYARGAPRLKDGRRKSLFEVEPEFPHMVGKPHAPVLLLKPVTMEHDSSLVLPLLKLRGQKGELVYRWRSTAKGEHSLRLWDDALHQWQRVLTGGYFIIDYADGVRPWPEHMLRLRQILKVAPYARSTT